MTIGILSLPLWNNYGGIVQAYALQKVLQDNGVETLLIDYHHKEQTKKNILLNSFKRFIKSELLSKKNVPYYPNLKQKEIISKNTLSFINSEIKPKTKRLTSFEELKELNDILDGVIVGSDQVWRPSYTPDIHRYFLDFVDGNKLKIAYAASFGTENWLFNKEQAQMCKILLKDFDAVSVREYSGLDLVKEKFETKAIKTLDPTFLLDTADYLELTRKYNEPKSNGNLFTYILDENNANKIIINKVSETFDLQPFNVMPKPFDKLFNAKNESYVFSRVTSWIKAFEDAGFVIADSFHGCVFSILFNKPFIAIGNQERGLTRFQSLLRTFNLEDRLILKPEDLSNRLLYSEINWNYVNEKLEQQKKLSINFLINSIKNGR